MSIEGEALADALSGVRDDVVNNLQYTDEVELCEDLAPIIKRYGLATVANALDSIKQGGAWTRGT